jgi:hypothetical protein
MSYADRIAEVIERHRAEGQMPLSRTEAALVYCLEGMRVVTWELLCSQLADILGREVSRDTVYRAKKRAAAKGYAIVVYQDVGLRLLDRGYRASYAPPEVDDVLQTVTRAEEQIGRARELLERMAGREEGDA